MTHQIQIKNWHYTCGDGCCDDYGMDLIVDGETIDTQFDFSVETLELILIMNVTKTIAIAMMKTLVRIGKVNQINGYN